MKRYITLFLSLALLLTFIPADLFCISANAATSYSGTCGTNINWTLDTDGTLTISGTGEMKNYIWRGAPWYNYRASIKIIEIKNGVTHIGNTAFEHCNNLTGVSIPDSVISIGDESFYNCSSLVRVVIPHGVVSIGWGAFNGCTEMVLVEIPDTVTSISKAAFYNCPKIEAFYVDGRNLDYSNDLYGVLYNKNQTTLIQAPAAGLFGSYTIPEGVTLIKGDAFNNCNNLTDITIPNSVSNIESGAFGGCSRLTNITLPNGIPYISSSTFYECTSLTSVTIPDSVAFISDSAFSGCTSLASITIPSSVTSIARNTFYGCTGITDVYYQGAEDGWNKISINSTGNEALTSAAIHYAITPDKEHNYTCMDTGRSISLGDQIYINQYVTVSGFDGIDVASNGGLLIWNSPVTEEEALYGSADTTQEGLIYHEGEYTQRTLGVSAKNYADEVYLRVYIKVADGEYVYSPLVEYSVQDYCEHKINTAGYTADLKKTCAALLHYGAMAQRYFNHNTQDLANANILQQYPAPTWMQ